ncbi:MAG: hypothetical protein M3317_13675, partial [Actinomycetota bacterium]|nr:hypothetical protein [Actinomycetota bacterium]
LVGTQWIGWVAQWIFIPGAFPTLTFLLLLFPAGRLPTRRWRLVGWLAALSIATTTFGLAFTPGPLPDSPQITNPLGVAPLRGSYLEHGGIGWLLFMVSVVLSAASLVVRYRGAGGVEREQLKWFAFAGALVAFGWVAQELTYGSEGPLTIGAQLLQQVSLVGLPIAVGVAILRYRLYDIDVLINRTLVYGSLTAMLAAFYFGGIVVLQRVFVVLTGEKSTLAVVASTILIAALFNPLRRRIQSFIDRRFYRSRYDARRTLESFSAKLRDETDLDALSDDLIGAVRETMQPAHVSLWLRPDTAPQRQEIDQ